MAKVVMRALGRQLPQSLSSHGRSCASVPAEVNMVAGQTHCTLGVVGRTLL